jgi:hypothetical protein
LNHAAELKLEPPDDEELEELDEEPNEELLDPPNEDDELLCCISRSPLELSMIVRLCGLSASSHVVQLEPDHEEQPQCFSVVSTRLCATS